MSKVFPYHMHILYEDADCLVVDKPAGLVVHPDGRNPGPFLTDWVLETYPDTAGVGEPINTPEGENIIRPGIVHRLDRETSGAIIVAKTAAGHASLKSQFQARTVTKKYLSFVWGELKEEFGTITRPIGRSGNKFPLWSAQRGIRGETREAETYWTRLWTGRAREIDGGTEDGAADKFTLICAEPRTGRTHQIRVHFLAVHHPVVGDTLYAPKKPMMLGFSRLALHARSISFTTLSGQNVTVESPPPADFLVACERLGIPIKTLDAHK